MHNIAITSIGSGVGQSVVDSLRLCGLKLRLFGYGNNPLAYGNADCDQHRVLPGIHDPDYLAQLLAACQQDRIELLIPGLDDELLLLAKAQAQFEAVGVRLALCSPSVIELCRDKRAMSERLNAYGGHFVRGYSVLEARRLAQSGQLPLPLIAKPLDGFASRGIRPIRSAEDLDSLDQGMLVQELAAPASGALAGKGFWRLWEQGRVLQNAELSAQLLFDAQGRELGRFLSHNNLREGVPVEVIPLDLPALWQAVDEFLPTLAAMGLRGPFNLQGRWTDQGVKFFEMNARFTGITGLRAMLGFNEVAALVAGELGLAQPEALLQHNRRRVGLRQVAARCVDASQLQPSTLSIADAPGQPRRDRVAADAGQCILLTGATGYLGRELLGQLLAQSSVRDVLVPLRQPGRQAESLRKNLGNAALDKLRLISYQDLLSGQQPFGHVDVLCHMASARPHSTSGELAESLALTQQLFSLAARHQTSLIFASSQAVYGRQRPPLWQEDDALQPETTYACHKMAGELMAGTVADLHRHCAVSVLRFSALYGGLDQSRLREAPHAMLVDALETGYITVHGGQQRLDLLSVTDAARAVIALLGLPSGQWPATLNIGSGSPVSVLKLAEQCAALVNQLTGRTVQIDTQAGEHSTDFGMDISRAAQSIHWQPRQSSQSVLQAWLQRRLSNKASETA